METAFYLYTIVVMLVCVASGSVSLSAYFVSRRRSFLFAAAMLLFYFLDLALIFQYEYLGQNVEYSINQFYTIDHPQLKILLALGTLEPMWLILCDFVNERRRAWRLAPALVFVATSEIVVLCLPVDEFRQWLFYTLRQAFLLWCLAFGAYRYCTARNEVEKARLCRQEPLFLVTTALCLCVLIEDIGMILVLDASSSPMPIFCLSISASGTSPRTSCFWPCRSSPCALPPTPCVSVPRNRRAPTHPIPRNTWTSCFPPSASAIT